MTRKPGVLFFVETVTMAHLTRVIELASGLGSQYEIFLAAFEIPKFLESSVAPFKVIHLKNGLSSSEFSSQIAQGKMPYSEDLLQRYIDEELDLINRVQPELVISDYRLTLAISRQIVWFKHVNLTNAVWSPRWALRLPVPELPIHTWVSPVISQLAFNIVRPFVLRTWHSIFNRVAKTRGVKPIKTFLDLYCAGDEVLYLDPPDFFPGLTMQSNEHFIGAPLFSLPGEMPKLPVGPDVPLVYVSLGSSGNTSILPLVVEALRELPVQALISTSDRSISLESAPNIQVHPLLPAREVLRKSRLIIGNGGSPSSYLALSEGVPVLALASNMDQHLNAQVLENTDAGIYLRSDGLEKGHLKSVIMDLIKGPYSEKAEAWRKSIHKTNAKLEFKKFIDSKIPESKIFQKELE